MDAGYHLRIRSLASNFYVEELVEEFEIVNSSSSLCLHSDTLDAFLDNCRIRSPLKI